MEVVQVEQVRRLRREAGDPAGPREVEHLPPAEVGDERTRCGGGRERPFDRAAELARPGVLAGEPARATQRAAREVAAHASGASGS